MPASFSPLDAAESARPEFVPPLLLGTPQGREWQRVGDLADRQSGALGETLAAMAAVRGYADNRAIGAGFALITSAAVAGLVYRSAMGLPVPVLSPGRTWWQMRPSANVVAVAVAGHLDFRPPDHLADVLHLLLDGLYGAIQERTGFPPRALWSLLASAIGYWLIELWPDDHARAVALGESIFASDAVLKAVKPRVTWLEVEGEAHAFTTRRVCCFNYLGRGGDYCSSQCPIVPPAERLALAVQQMTRDQRPA